jgi:hypothetical protein
MDRTAIIYASSQTDSDSRSMVMPTPTPSSRAILRTPAPLARIAFT